MSAVQKAIPGIMSKFRIGELSGVNRPAQTGARAVFMKRDDGMFDPVIKRDFTDDQRKELAGRGLALPDGSFPIESEADLHNAIRAIGRAKDEAKAKAHIVSRAKSMGLSSALPENWTTKADDGLNREGESDMDKELLKSLGLPETATAADVAKAVAAVVAKAAKAEEDGAKAKADAEKATRKAAMTADEKAHTDGMSDGDADDFMQKPAADRASAISNAKKNDETFVAKGVTIRKSAVGADAFAFMKAQAEEIAANTLAIAKANEIAADAVFAKRAGEELSHMSGTVEERAAMLKGVEAISDPIAKAAALKGLQTANTLAKSAFGKIGTGGGMGNGNGGGAATADTLNDLAKDYMKNNPKTTFAKAYDTVCVENPALYEKAELERRERAAAAH
jgi:hypothetical protein